MSLSLEEMSSRKTSHIDPSYVAFETAVL